MFQGTAVYEQSMILAAQPGDELVHNPAVHPYELVLSSLAEQRHLRAVHFKSAQHLENHRRGHFERRRRAQARSQRYVPFYG